MDSICPGPSFNPSVHPPSDGPVCSSSISDMLIAVCLWILLEVAILYLLMPQQIYSTKTKHIYIAMYITMQKLSKLSWQNSIWEAQ